MFMYCVCIHTAVDVSCKYHSLLHTVLVSDTFTPKLILKVCSPEEDLSWKEASQPPHNTLLLSRLYGGKWDWSVLGFMMASSHSAV